MIVRAAEIWGKALHNPKFDNGDNSQAGGLGHMLATMNMQNAKENVPSLVDQVEKFKKVLVSNLIAQRDSGEYFRGWLDTDYHPCKELAGAANEAGIPHNLFSCKSTVMINEDCVGASFGYGSERINHYPLPNGKWLLTTLTGSDITKIIDQVMNGNLMGLRVE